jgi:N-acetylglucosaminyl-diphospho-decaprenol L-rhamnosyltransferase
MQIPPLVSVIVVNYNSGSYAKTCIESLLKQANVRLEIIVVDNASVDDSVNVLKNAFGEKIILTESMENLGFGNANNLAATVATGEFLLLLNPDTEISDIQAISRLINFMNAQPQYGLVGPKIFEPRKNKFVSPHLTYPASKRLKFTPELAQLPGEIAWLLGACMLVRRAVYTQIKGFDKDYFLYGEDADICLRIRQLGLTIGYCEAVTIQHASGASEIGADSLDKWLRKKRGIMLFYKKNYHKNDVMRIAKSAVIQSRIGLSWLKITHLFSRQQTDKTADKRHRLEATLIVAKEVINQSN